jgi:hypothetical protein
MDKFFNRVGASFRDLFLSFFFSCLLFTTAGRSEWVSTWDGGGSFRASAEGQVELGIKVPSRQPNGSRGKGRYSLGLGNDYGAFWASGEDYLESNAAEIHYRSYGVALHVSDERSLHRLSVGVLQLSPLWHSLYDLPHSYRLSYGKLRKALLYELVYLHGVQLALAAFEEGSIKPQVKQESGRGGVAKLAWQWPGQESSRFGAGWELDSKGKYQGLSVIFQNRGFKNQVFSGEWLRKKDLSSTYILSNILVSTTGFDSKVLLAISNRDLWQISLERWTRLWKDLGWSLTLDLKRRPEEETNVGLGLGIGGKL